MYFSGYIGMVFHSLQFLRNEETASLFFLTDIKDMFRKLKNPSEREYNYFTYYLSILTKIREQAFVFLGIGLTSLYSVGALITAVHFNDLYFYIGIIPVVIVFTFLQQWCAQMLLYVLYLVAQSSVYFMLRLDRIDYQLRRLLSFRDSPRFNDKFESMKHLIRKHLEIYGSPKVFHSSKSQDPDKDDQLMRRRFELNLNREIIETINSIIFDLNDIFLEIKRHNVVFKKWLRDELHHTGGIYICAVVFVLGEGEAEWYYRMLPFLTFTMTAIAVYISFTNAAKLHIHIRATARVMHSCQTLIRHYDSSFHFMSDEVHRNCKSASDVHMTPNPFVVVQTKYRLYRMITRMTEPRLKVSFTEGNGESFSPESAFEFICSIAFTSLMFLNSRYSALKDILMHEKPKL